MSARLVADMDEREYHAHPALSSSGARKLLPPSCPALFRHDRDHGQAHKAEFDFGHAAHASILGIGSPVRVVEASDWRTNAAKAARQAAYEAGETPLLPGDAAQVEAMASALRQHDIASALLNPERGRPEMSAFWHDDRHGIDRRARFDWLPDADGGRLLIADYKTCQSADPAAIRKSVANWGYHQQAAYYLDAVTALDLADIAVFLFVFQQKTAPYLVTVCELDAEAMRIGAALNDRAMSLYADCLATDTWPGYSNDVELISLPSWATYSMQELIA